MQKTKEIEHKWLCDQCDRYNFSESKKCLGCQRVRPQAPLDNFSETIPRPQPEVVIGIDEWQCQQCTMLNRIDWKQITSAICSACEITDYALRTKIQRQMNQSSYLNHETPQPLADGEWKCYWCNTLNLTDMEKPSSAYCTNINCRKIDKYQ